MAKRYKMFTLTGIEDADQSPIIFVGDDKEIVRYSNDKDADKFFNNWSVEAFKEGGDLANFDEQTTGYQYYTCEEGDYVDSGKTAVDALIKKFGY